ncbi:unnamed protein product [Hermetia illucens]|uniref:Peptidase S1 domain-containing protein n=1 Tax=Hermetia illucens TaxID=343691 RepID=A0A7R8YPX6_HERIL|nr:uncharacterized protein LOC119660992 [Hermetia illucens]CAD7079920.1 unnamed protein product [Hermetia illucens]
MYTKLLILIIQLFMQYVGRSFSEKAGDGQFPSLVAIADPHKHFIASGCLITLEHIISAAKPFIGGKTLMVLAGSVSLEETAKNKTQYRWIVQSSIHPEYSRTQSSFHDVALSRLSKPFDISQTIHPIKEHSSFRRGPKKCFSVGWEIRLYKNFESESNTSTEIKSFVGVVELAESTSASPEYSDDLQYQQLQVLSQKECHGNQTFSTICALRNSTESNPPQLGIFLICSKKLRGMLSARTHRNSTITLFENIGKFSSWINRELSLSKITLQNYRKSLSSKQTLANIWILSIEVFKALFYFIKF